MLTVKVQMHSAWEAEGGGACSLQISGELCVCVRTDACADQVTLFLSQKNPR